MKIELEKVFGVIKEAGEFLKNREGANHITEKGASDYVTEVDLKVQQYIGENLKQLAPEIQFLGEEAADCKVDFDQSVWILDPVDGTTNLIHDYKHSVISLALVEQSKVVLGIIYDPYRDEMFWAKKGEGAFLNGEAIKVSSNTKLADSLITIGTSPYHKELAEENFEIFKRVFMDSQDIRRSGSAALDLAWIACGRIEGYFERKLKIWDYAAGLLLVQEAGGKITNYKGDLLGVQRVADIVAGNKEIVETLVKEYLS